MIGIWTLLSIALSLLLPTQGHAVVYRTCAQEFYPKFYMYNNEMRGYSVDIINALQRLDKNIHFEGHEVFCTIPRVEEDLRAGRKDVFVGAFKTPEREKKFHFLEVPLYVLKYVVVVRKEDNVKVSSFEDIRKLGKEGVILTLVGTGLQKFLEQQSNLKIEAVASSLEANLRMLENKRGRFLFTVDLGLKALLNESPWKNKFAILPAVFGGGPQFIMASRKMQPKNIDLLYASLKRLQASGELERIFQNYKKDQIDTKPILTEDRLK